MPSSPYEIVQSPVHQADRDVVLVKAVQTCIACPSQWDAWDADGRYYYLRHRHGRGSVDTFDDPNPKTWGPAPLGEVAHFRGELEYDLHQDERAELFAFCEAAGITLAPDAAYIRFEDYVRRASL